MPRDQVRRLLLGTYVLVGVLQLVAITVDFPAGRAVTKLLLMPLLFVVVVLSGPVKRHSSIPLLLVGLVFAWLGDLFLLSDQTLAFGLGMLSFLVMQICYTVGFFRLGARDAFRRRRWVLIVYPAIWLAAVALLAPQLGILAAPIAIYGAFLATMAMTSMSLGTLIGIGGTTFMISDAMIGTTVAFDPFPGSSQLIMLTYIVAQAIIILWWLGQVRAAQAGAAPNTRRTPASA